ncbi:MAG: hypothetical protein NEA02_16735 [Thermoanaerobaculia bacterium]|nr:hypothetical protein [Thermoanaerobaculia bacterium]
MKILRAALFGSLLASLLAGARAAAPVTPVAATTPVARTLQTSVPRAVTTQPLIFEGLPPGHAAPFAPRTVQTQPLVFEGVPR